MKISELLKESTADQLLTTINDIIASYDAKGVETVSVAELVIALQKMGLNATEDGISSVATDSPFVQSVENGEIQLGGSVDLVDAGENSDDQVDHMASGAVDI